MKNEHELLIVINYVIITYLVCLGHLVVCLQDTHERLDNVTFTLTRYCNMHDTAYAATVNRANTEREINARKYPFSSQ